jgi:hypothetical protein
VVFSIWQKAQWRWRLWVPSAYASLKPLKRCRSRRRRNWTGTLQALLWKLSGDRRIRVGIIVIVIDRGDAGVGGFAGGIAAVAIADGGSQARSET